MLPWKSDWLGLSLVAVLSLITLSLAACKPSAPQADNGGDAAMRAAGYARAPEISMVGQDGNGSFVVEGQALPDGRVRFTYAGQRAIGVTADSQGHYKAELPSSGLGGVYDLSIEDNGRLIYADGRLFIPAGQPAKAVLMRTGSPSRPIMRRAGVVSVVDYDSAGALGLSGYVSPNANVQVILGDEIRAEAISDATGYYSATTQIPPPTATDAPVTLIVQAKGQSVTHSFTVS
eukprot:gene15817-20033_t